MKIWQGNREMWTIRSETTFASRDVDGNLREASATPSAARDAVCRGSRPRLSVDSLWAALFASAPGSHCLVSNTARRSLGGDAASRLMFGRVVEWFDENMRDACAFCHEALGAVLVSDKLCREIRSELETATSGVAA